MSPFDCLVLAHFLAWSDCSLELLDLCGCSLTHHCLEIMHTVCSEHCGTTLIEVVNFSRNHLDPTTTLSFISRIPVFEHTKTLMLHYLLYPEKVSPDCIELDCLQHLSTLDISVKNIPDSSRARYSLSLATLVIALGNCKLQVLRFQDGSIDGQDAVNLFKSLEHSTRLEELNLSKNSQLAEGDKEAVGCAIEGMLRVNTRLKLLTLRYCELDTAVAIHIGAGLEHNTSLEELNLSENHQLAVGGSDAVGCAIERMLRVNRRLKLLNLHHCELDTAVAIHIAAGLEHNTSLEELNLSENRQLAVGGSEAVVCAIERMLRVNTRLKVLNLRNCGLDTAVAIHIAAGLEHSSLAELNIASNSSITSEGGIHIFKHLHNNLSLKKLNISYCGLEDSSSAALAEMLSRNKSLIELTIGNCGIHEAGLTELAKGLLQNTSLQTLRIDEYANTKPPCRKTFLEAEIERLKRSGNFTLRRSVEIKEYT